jgi:hypothetical protein
VTMAARRRRCNARMRREGGAVEHEGGLMGP